MPDHNDETVVKRLEEIKNYISSPPGEEVVRAYNRLVESLSSIPSSEVRGLLALAIADNLYREVVGNTAEERPELVCTGVIMLDKRLESAGYESLVKIPKDVKEKITEAASSFLDELYKILRNERNYDVSMSDTQVHSHASGRMRFRDVQTRYLLYALAELPPKDIKRIEVGMEGRSENSHYNSLSRLYRNNIVRVVQSGTERKTVLTGEGEALLEEWYKRMKSEGVVSRVVDNLSKLNEGAAHMLISKLQDLERRIETAGNIQNRYKKEAITSGDEYGSIDEINPIYRKEKIGNTGYLVIETQGGDKYISLLQLGVFDPRKKRSVNRFSAELIFLQVLEELEREKGKLDWDTVYDLINAVPASREKGKEIKRKILFDLVSRGAVVENEDGSVSMDETYRCLLHRSKKDLMGCDFENVSEIEKLDMGVVRRSIERVGEIIVPPPSVFAKLVRNYKKDYSQGL